MTQVIEHPFELAGLGRAPFRFVGLVSLPSPALAEQNPSAFANAMRDLPRGIGVGTCAFCGQAIVNNAIVQDATGKRFVVGCDCIRKISTGKLVSAMQAAINAEKRAKARLARNAAHEARRAAAAALLDAERTRNGGRTDWEVAQGAARAKQVAARAGFMASNAWLIDVLRRQPGAFCQSVADDLETRAVSALSPRCREIVREIFIKATGGRNPEARRSAEAAFDAATTEGVDHRRRS